MYHAKLIRIEAEQNTVRLNRSRNVDQLVIAVIGRHRNELDALLTHDILRSDCRP